MKNLTKTLADAIDYWPVYDGSMMIDNRGNQYYIQDWESLEGIGYTDTNWRTHWIDASKITENSVYEQIKFAIRLFNLENEFE